MFEWAEAAANFGVGFAKGVGDFVVSTVVGVADLAVTVVKADIALHKAAAETGYRLATDPAYREQAWQATKNTVKTVQQGIDYTVHNPEKVAKAAKDLGEKVAKVARDAAVSAYADYQAEADKAAAEGRLAEFTGHALGRVLPELISPGKFLKLAKLGKVIESAEVVADIAKIKTTETVVELGRGAKAVRGAEGGVGSIIKKGKTMPRSAPCATQGCPLTKGNKLAKNKKTTAGIGKTKNNAVSGPKKTTKIGGEPVSMVTGEELLTLEDFLWDGPVPLVWTRFYRTAQSGTDLQLGHGWLCPLDEWLHASADGIVWHDCEGRRVDLALPEPGGISINLPEQVRLHREPGGYRLETEDGPDRWFADTAGHCALLRWQNETGHTITLVRDAAGQVQALAASWGDAVRIDRVGQRIASIGPARLEAQGYEATAPPWVRYQYDAAGDLVGNLNRLDQGERYAYGQHLILQRTLASGFAFHFEWDRLAPDARCLRSRGDGGIFDTRFEWTAGGISRAIDSRGGVTEYMHDAHALLLWHTTPEGRTTRYAYDRNKLLHSSIDAAGGVTCFEHDEEGRLVAVADALGQRTEVQLDEAGRPQVFIDALGQVWRREHDGQGRVVLAVDPQGGETRIDYNPLGLPGRIVNALGQIRSLLWDAQARLVGEVGFDGIRRSYQHDAEGRIVTALTQDKRRTTYGYDALGRAVQVTGPDGAVVRLAYSALGQLLSHWDAAGRRIEYRYADGLAEPSQRIDPLGHSLNYRYDSERNLVGLVNAKGEVCTLTYDLDELLVAQTGFDGRQQCYRYGPAGHLRVQAQRWGDGWRETLFERDALGQLLRQSTPGGANTVFAHDALGRLVSAGFDGTNDGIDAEDGDSASRGRSPVRLRYGALGQCVEEAQEGGAVRHDFNAIGQRTATHTPDGRMVTYSHDGHGRVVGVQLDGQTVTRHRFDDLGQESARQQGALASRYEHDPAGRLLHHQAGLAGTTFPVLARRYGYDVSGQLNAVDDLRQGQSRYFYDPAARLLQVEGALAEVFAHDPAGNLVGMDLGSADGGAPGRVEGDRLLMLGDRHFSYDEAGNLVQERRGKAGSQVTRYQYDSDNRLVCAQTPGGTSRYRYDALGRRIAKATPWGETRFVYDGARLLSQTSGERQTLLLFEPDSFRPLVRIDRDRAQAIDKVYHYHLDHLGTPREMTDAGGRIVWSGRLRAYGALALADVSEIDNPIRFQGQYFDAETGLHYNLNRYYDPLAGRFIHQDPIGLDGGVNLYQYVPDPFNWVDPLGLKCKSMADGGKGVHGNSKASPKLNHRYEIVENSTEDVVKTGISGEVLNLNGTSRRANSQVNALNRVKGPGTYSAVLREINLPGRQAALDAERLATTQLHEAGNSLVLQHRPKP